MITSAGDRPSSPQNHQMSGRNISILWPAAPRTLIAELQALVLPSMYDNFAFAITTSSVWVVILSRRTPRVANRLTSSDSSARRPLQKPDELRQRGLHEVGHVHQNGYRRAPDGRPDARRLVQHERQHLVRDLAHVAAEQHQDVPRTEGHLLPRRGWVEPIGEQRERLLRHVLLERESPLYGPSHVLPERAVVREHRDVLRHVHDQLDGLRDAERGVQSQHAQRVVAHLPEVRAVAHDAVQRGGAAFIAPGRRVAPQHVHHRGHAALVVGVEDGADGLLAAPQQLRVARAAVLAQEEDAHVLQAAHALVQVPLALHERAAQVLQQRRHLPRRHLRRSAARQHPEGRAPQVGVEHLVPAHLQLRLQPLEHRAHGVRLRRGARPGSRQAAQRARGHAAHAVVGVAQRVRERAVGAPARVAQRGDLQRAACLVAAHGLRVLLHPLEQQVLVRLRAGPAGGNQPQARRAHRTAAVLDHQGQHAAQQRRGARRVAVAAAVAVGSRGGRGRAVAGRLALRVASVVAARRFLRRVARRFRRSHLAWRARAGGGHRQSSAGHVAVTTARGAAAPSCACRR
eukprot:scaffold1054_cov366-Prasinococcus_capsulatus_cf.AAC.22